MKLKVFDEDEEMVSIGFNYQKMMDAFIDIYVDNPFASSPFKTHEEAKLFAEIIVKLMEAILDGDS